MPRSRNVVLLILIFGGLLAILVSAYVRYGIPYDTEQRNQKYDEQRISDLNILNSQIAMMLTISSTTSLGNPRTVYISLPASDPECSKLDLPSLPEGWTYHCPSLSTMESSDGTGWLPFSIDMPRLYTDPVNAAEPLNYYAFVSTTTTPTPGVVNRQYVLTATLDSGKYLSETAKKDEGTDLTRYETGSNLKLWSDMIELLGFWPLQDGNYEAINIAAPQNEPGAITSPLWTEEKNERVLLFNGNNYVTVNDPSLNKIGNLFNPTYSIVLWFKSSVRADQSITENWPTSNYPWAIRGPLLDGTISFSVFSGKFNIGSSARINTMNLADGNWHLLVAIRDGQAKRLKLYIDGDLVKEVVDTTAGIDVSSPGPFVIGARYVNGENGFRGSIKQMFIYQRELTPYEIKRLGQVD